MKQISRLKQIYPDLYFYIAPFANKPISGRRNEKESKKKGFVIYDEPEFGGFQTTQVRTDSMSPKQIEEAVQEIIHEVDGKNYLYLTRIDKTIFTTCPLLALLVLWQ